MIHVFSSTGREIFVGVSQRTNLSGALAVASAFPEFYVTPINVPRKVVHLKSCISMAGPDILCVGSSPEAQEILRVSLSVQLVMCTANVTGSGKGDQLSNPLMWYLCSLQRIASEASFPYTTITVHDNESANCLYINGTLGKSLIVSVCTCMKIS